MSLPQDVRRLVRERAHFACEYCGVSETDCGGELTIDHYQPPRRGGAQEHPDNLLYCCQRCNQYKSDYWPRSIQDIPLWNPRTEHRATHVVPLADGTLYPLTPVGAFTVRRLRLNRAPLIAHRLRQYRTSEETRLLEELRQLLVLQERLQQQYATMLREQHELLEHQRALLALLINRFT